MFKTTEVEVKDLKAGDSIALPINVKHNGLVNGQVQEVELVFLYDVLSAARLKLAKSCTLEIKKVPNKKDEETKVIAYTVNEDAIVSLIELIEEEAPKKPSKKKGE